MAAEKVNAHKITKPIQLWAAWLVALIAIETAFLTAGVKLDPGWERSALTIAAICFVPLFLGSAVLLQTKFRAELQEDSYYAKTVNRKTDSPATITKLDQLESKIELAFHTLSMQIAQATAVSLADVKSHLASDWSSWKIAINKHCPRYHEITAAFLQAGIPIDVVFGTNKSPTKWIVGINENIPKDLAIKALLVLIKFNFDGFAFWIPIRDIGETEDVYIGSYGEGPYVLLTTDFNQNVHDELSLSEYIIKHTKL